MQIIVMSALFVRYGVGSCRWRHVLNSVALPSESQVKTNRGEVYRRYAQSSHGREKVAAVCNERRLYCRDPWAFQWILQFKKKKKCKIWIKRKGLETQGSNMVVHPNLTSPKLTPPKCAIYHLSCQSQCLAFGSE